MYDRLQSVEQRFAEIEELLARPEVSTDRERVQALAKGVYNAVQTFCPDRLVLSGAMSAAGKALWEPVRRYVDGRVWWTKERLGDRIVPSALGNDAALLGAASLLI